MSGRRNTRQYRCPQCNRLLAHVHCEYLVLRRLIQHFDNAVKSEKQGEDIVLTCQCGHVYTIHWPLLQK